MGIIQFFKNAFKSMKESAKAQHEVDKANFAAAKAEAKANFEENRGRNTFARAKAGAKQSWDDAHMTPSQRQAKTKEDQQAQIEKATKRKEDADARYNALKKK